MLLLQMFLPIYDQKGAPFPSQHFLDLRQELTEKFGGVTTYSRSPVKGLWKEADNSVVADEMIIYEIMIEELDTAYWNRLKIRLQDLFRQDEILMRYHEISKV